MTAAARRLAHFLLGLVCLLAALEWVVQSNIPFFVTASYGDLTKAAIFEQHPETRFLFLGTSRTREGVSPWLVTKALLKNAPELGELPGFNGAFVGTNINVMLSLGARFASPGLLAVIIEPPRSAQATPDKNFRREDSATMPVTLENGLAGIASQLAIVRYRKAFRTRSLFRMLSLLVFAPALNGGELGDIGHISAWLGWREPEAVDFDPTLWSKTSKPFALPNQGLSSEADLFAVQLMHLTRLFRQQGTKVVFAAPPLSREFQPTHTERELTSVLATIVSRCQCEFWNFSSIPLPDSVFRNPSHLNREGRAHYSQALALHLAKLLRNGDAV